MLRFVRSLALALAAGALVGCATVRPASTVPPTGWPADPTSGRPTASATATRAASPSPTASASLKRITVDGVELPLPEGYSDATALVGAAPTAGASRLIAFLRNPGQHTITTLWLTTDKQDLASYLQFFVSATNAGSEQTIVEQAPVTVAGLPGARVTLKSKADAAESVVYVAMRAPGSLVQVQGTAGTPERRQALETVATGMRIVAQG